MLTRRDFLVSTALAGTAGLSVGPAFAFSITEAPKAINEMYLEACTARGFHDTLIAEVSAMLEDGTLAEDLKRKLAQGNVRCPFCNCAVQPAS